MHSIFLHANPFALTGAILCLWLIGLQVGRRLYGSSSVVAGRHVRIVFHHTYISCEFLSVDEKFQAMAIKLGQLLQPWLTFGAIVMCCSLALTSLAGLYYLYFIVYSFLFQTNLDMIGQRIGKQNFEMMSILPGINFPVSQLFVLFISIFLMFTWHEVGHAIAAAHFGLEVYHFMD